nr:TRAP transporter substrate-binding protein [uncultured Cohaesibacter sp.]
MKRIFAKSTSALAFMVGLSVCTAYSAEINMKFATPSIYNPKEISIHWLPKAQLKNEIEARSGGRISVKLFAKGQLGKTEDLPNQLRANVIQGFDCSDGPLAPLFSDIQILSIPYLFKNREIAWEVMDGPFGDELADRMAAQTGLRPLAYSDLGYRHFSTKDKPIIKVEDMKGMKIRTMTNPVHMAMVEALGAHPTPVAWDELYTALQTGVVNGQENPIGNFIQPKLFEVQHHLTLDGHILLVYFYLVNDAWYQSLSPEDQGIIKQSYRVAAETMRGVSIATEQRDTETLVEEGMTIHPVPAAEKAKFQKLSQAAVLPMIKEQVDAELVDLLYAEIAKAEQKFGYQSE